MAEDTTDPELLIALVHSRPILWDKSLDKYRHLAHTKAAWVEVFRSLNEEYDSMTHSEQETFSREVIKKWANLRDAYVKSLKKNRRYIYGDQLQFLARLYEGKEADPLEDEEKEAEDESRNFHIRDPPVDVNSEQLIGCVEKWPCLWDKSLATYKDRIHVKSAWLAVVRELNPDFDQLEAYDQENYRREIVKKWNNMRDTYAKSLKRTPFKAKKYVYADQMYFLRRFYAAYDEVDPGDEEWRTQADEEMEMLPDPPHVVLHEHVEETVLLPTWDVEPNATSAAIQEKPATHHGNPNREPTYFTNPKKRKRQEHQSPEQDEVEQRILTVLDRLEPDNRHLSFFRGIIPSLENFDEDEVLQFQMQVLQIIKDMRKQKTENPTDLPSNSYENNTTHLTTVKTEVSEQSSSSSE